MVPKYRKRLLYGSVRQRAGEIIRYLAKQKGVEVIEGKACSDHIHMLVSIPPKFSVSHIIGFMKGKSAIRLHFEFSKNRRHLTQKSFWSRGYCVSTVGLDQEQIAEYIKNQHKKDRNIDGDQLDFGWN
jgi:putative transposase